MVIEHFNKRYEVVKIFPPSLDSVKALVIDLGDQSFELLDLTDYSIKRVKDNDKY